MMAGIAKAQAPATPGLAAKAATIARARASFSSV
jgi:hypothetical protein